MPATSCSRRSFLGLCAAGAFAALPARTFGQDAAVTVYKDPNCLCCTGWVWHLTAAGFSVRTINTGDLIGVKQRLAIPADLAACHTAVLGAYLIEGHVPARAINRLLAERPQASGLAVPGMPVGSPGMEGAREDRYDVILFGPRARTVYMTFVGARPV